MTEISSPPDGWPVPENTTLVSPAETAVQSPAPVPAGLPRDRGIGAGMLLAIVVFVLVAAAVLAALLLSRRGHSSTTTVVVTTAPATPGTATTPLASASASRRSVPDLGGLPLPQARATLAALGLRAATTPVSSGKPAGTIVEQAPKPGAKLTRGSSVTLLVSAAPPSTTVPASSTTAGGATAAATTSPATTTTATTTAASTTPVPPPPQTVSMPDVTNQNEASAAQRLAQAGILASIFFVPGNDPLGTVEQQAKPAGTTLPYHAHVQINVSRGPSDNPLEHVPRHDRQEPARRRLSFAGNTPAPALRQAPDHLTRPSRHDRPAVPARQCNRTPKRPDSRVPRRLPTEPLSGLFDRHVTVYRYRLIDGEGTDLGPFVTGSDDWQPGRIILRPEADSK